ncbi:TraR/DksA family transcriptional regulator [Glycomyces buryatensis]|uniref:TraR/DksA family transcriptional regulator n=1 Tax=Glycomyces buryatensis TaxID=2570927 RepID=A0A4S8Q5U6_9ACTN|nr:TraR/DksA family transcriptional regulator [Glycomyces buryatensis]THV39528.1 TraR/DksA family transcriptional regulator [Glycomyces buryatensis]
MSTARKSQSSAAKKAAKKTAKKTAVKKAAPESGVKATVKKATAKKTAAKKATKPAAKKTTAKKAVSKAVPEQAPEPSPVAEQIRTEAEQSELRSALKERLDELVEEQQRFVDSIAMAQRERLSDTAGDDQVDSGTKTVEHEHEVTVANSLSERILQVSHALERLDEGDYGVCEKCGKPIPAARLAAFPSATLCVSCKQLEERR